MFNYTEHERYMKTVRQTFPFRLQTAFDTKTVKDWSVVAKYSGLNASAIYAFRDGRTMPTARSLIVIACSLGVSIDWLLSLPMRGGLYMPEDCAEKIWCIYRDMRLIYYCTDKFYRLLDTLRHEKDDIPQIVLAQELGLTYGAVKRARRTRSIFKADNLGWLCYHFGVSADWILGLTEVERAEIGFTEDSAIATGGREPQELTAFSGLASAT